MMMVLVGAVGGGVLIIMLIVVIILICHHRRKNKKLKKELTLKKEEINTLSRQASFRRVNSVSIDTREIEESIPLRVEGTLRNSLSSLRVSLHFIVNLHARPGPGTEALLSRCRTAKF
ncbi:hypothetical protein ATANTOWER_019098 [Ataeniobius toweri]|uniref:Uncharacterized protein n=1 Tax=Ataeniobius toweri TaxID=208326 RepID=A0ABU7CBQ4_9TELE|nr:hypothetical protein [Ataeniobius toweri]